MKINVESVIYPVRSMNSPLYHRWGLSPYMWQSPVFLGTDHPVLWGLSPLPRRDSSLVQGFCRPANLNGTLSESKDEFRFH